MRTMKQTKKRMVSDVTDRHLHFGTCDSDAGIYPPTPLLLLLLLLLPTNKYKASQFGAKAQVDYSTFRIQGKKKHSLHTLQDKYWLGTSPLCT